MKSTYTTSWYGENFCIKSCHLKVGKLVLQGIIFLTNNLDKLRHLKKDTVGNYFKPREAFLFSGAGRGGVRRKADFGFRVQGLIDKEHVLRDSQLF